jgi:hypothetical protein
MCLFGDHALLANRPARIGGWHGELEDDAGSFELLDFRKLCLEPTGE